MDVGSNCWCLDAACEVKKYLKICLISICLEMDEAISELIDLQKQINDIEIEFDLRRALLDYKHENVLKEAYERVQVC